jgi:hypothetical protein
MRYVYGFTNVAFYNRKPQGDRTWFASARARNVALRELRARAIAKGLSASAAQAGIYPVRRHVASEVGAAWLREIELAEVSS